MGERVFLNIPAPVFDRTLLELETSRRGSFAHYVSGPYNEFNRLELLHHSTEYLQTLGSELVKTEERGLSSVLLLVASEVPGGTDIAPFLRSALDSAVKRMAFVALVNDGSNIQAFGWSKTGELFRLIDMLSIPGAGMIKLQVQRLWPFKENGPSQGSEEGGFEDAVLGVGGAGSVEQAGMVGGTGSATRLSRLAAFLGEGDLNEGYKLLSKGRQLRVTFVGGGRAANRLLLELAQCEVGSRGGITVIDADTVELANLDAMLLPRRAVGMFKAEADACMVEALIPESRVAPLVGTISDVKAARAVASADMVFTCVDSDSARLGTAIIAARYNRVHIDVSGGAAFTRNRHFSAGGEVRLAVPGSAGCVGCMGIYDWDAALHELSASADEERRLRSATDWQSERPGSSGFILSSVTGTAMSVFQ